MTVLVVIYSLAAIGIILLTFRIGGRLEKTNREIAALDARIHADRDR